MASRHWWPCWPGGINMQGHCCPGSKFRPEDFLACSWRLRYRQDYSPTGHPLISILPHTQASMVGLFIHHGELSYCIRHFVHAFRKYPFGGFVFADRVVAARHILPLPVQGVLPMFLEAERWSWFIVLWNVAAYGCIDKVPRVIQTCDNLN